MKANRFIITMLSAAALVAAGACRTSSTTKTTTTSSTMDTTPAVSSSTSSSYGTTGTTTVADQNGTNVTRTTTTTTIYKNGQAVTTDANGNTIATTTVDNSSQASSTTAPVLPAGAAVVVTTTTTTKSTPATASASASVSGNQGVPATNSTTTYVPYEQRTFLGHRFPTMDILAFADRATFSDNNRAINGSLNTGPLSTSLRGENGWGVGINWYFGSRFSTEFTGSRIRPRATFTPTNSAFNPITGLRIRMTPITGAFQIHFMPHASINPYIGGGAEYVTFHADRGFNPGTSGLTSVNIRDEWGPMVQAGLRLGNAKGLSFNVDGKYSWIRARTQTTFDNVTVGNVGNGSRFGVNPLILSAGIRLGF